MTFEVTTPEEMISLGQRLAAHFAVGQMVLFRGELGSGKTTLIRGILRGLGWDQGVRSPTYNLFALYDVRPPVLHADLYRIKSAEGTGLEDYLDSHLCLVEWPEALQEFLDLSVLAEVKIEFTEGGRLVTLSNINL
jgi:tRNA threonylcarbamoyladenosine biosynthesis protein TsaE